MIQPDFFMEVGPRSLSGCVTPEAHAWRRLQAYYGKLIDRARARHGRRREIIRARTETVHAALRGRA